MILHGEKYNNENNMWHYNDNEVLNTKTLNNIIFAPDYNP